MDVVCHGRARPTCGHGFSGSRAEPMCRAGVRAALYLFQRFTFLICGIAERKAVHETYRRLVFFNATPRGVASTLTDERCLPVRTNAPPPSGEARVLLYGWHRLFSELARDTHTHGFKAGCYGQRPSDMALIFSLSCRMYNVVPQPRTPHQAQKNCVFLPAGSMEHEATVHYPRE